MWIELPPEQILQHSEFRRDQKRINSIIVVQFSDRAYGGYQRRQHIPLLIRPPSEHSGSSSTLSCSRSHSPSIRNSPPSRSDTPLPQTLFLRRTENWFEIICLDFISVGCRYRPRVSCPNGISATSQPSIFSRQVTLR